MNPDRLAELRRQRERVRQQLAWLDHEIDAATAARPAPSPPDRVAVEAGTADQLTHEATNELRAAEAFHPDPQGTARSARRGCLLYAALILFIAFATATLLYLVRYRDRPVLFAPADEPSSSAHPIPAKPSPARP